MNAALFGANLIIAGIACVVHAILPFLFVNTASTRVKKLNEELGARFQKE